MDYGTIGTSESSGTNGAVFVLTYFDFLEKTWRNLLIEIGHNSEVRATAITL